MTAVAVKLPEVRRIGSMQVLVVGMVALAVFGSALRGFVISKQDLATAATVFSGIFVQAIPFLSLGVVISGLVAAFVSPERLRRWLPRPPSIPWCWSRPPSRFPVSRRWWRRGASPPW
jgi:hypothetical protein